MKKLFKKFIRRSLLGLCVFGALITANAQSQKSGSLTNGVNLVRSGGTLVYQLQVLNSDAAAQMLTLYDNSSATSTNTAKTELTYYTWAIATNSNTFTNINGVVETNNFQYLDRSTVTVAAATNEATRVYRVTIPASSSALIEPADGFAFTKGVQAHFLGTNATYNMIYRGLP